MTFSERYERFKVTALLAGKIKEAAGDWPLHGNKRDDTCEQRVRDAISDWANAMGAVRGRSEGRLARNRRRRKAKA